MPMSESATGRTVTTPVTATQPSPIEHPTSTLTPAHTPTNSNNYWHHKRGQPTLTDKDLIGPTLINHEAALRDLFNQLVADGMTPADAAITASRLYAARLIAGILQEHGVAAEEAEALAAAGFQAVTQMEAAGVSPDLAVQLVFLGAATGLPPDQVAEQTTSQRIGEELFTLFANTAHLMQQAGLTRKDAELTVLLNLHWDELTALRILPPGYEDNGDEADDFFRMLSDRSDGDDRISKKDLEWIIENPDGIDPVLVDVAQRLLGNETLFARLDSASDENDFLNGQFGRTKPADHLISKNDLDAFVNMSIISHKLSPYKDQIDTAAKHDKPDGVYSRADYEAFLKDHSELKAEIDAILDIGLHDKGYWGRNRDSIALTAGVGAAILITYFSGGTLSTTSSTVIAGVASALGAADAAGVTTLLINADSGVDVNDGVLANMTTAAFLSLPTGAATNGMRAAIAGNTSRTVVLNITGGTADYLAAGGADFALPDDLETPIHIIGQATSLAPTSNPVTNISDAASSVPPLRQQYVDAVAGIGEVVAEMRAAGSPLEEIARAAHARRRALGVEFKELTPDSMRTVIS